MASTAHTSLECDYIRSHTSLHVFTSKQAELVHINEQIRLLDGHISQLDTLRRALHGRSRQLRNSLSLIHSLPVEVLSNIFQQATGREVYNYPKFQQYCKCLRQAFVLSSVSTYFRHVAFCTPELWRRIPLKMTVDGEMGQLVSLLRHCMNFAHIVDVFVDDRFDEEEAARSAIETPGLFTYDVTRRIRSLELSSRRGSDVWQPILKGSSFPILDNLGICGPGLTFDLGTFSTVTRLEIRNWSSDVLIIMPPSVRYLFLEGVGPPEFVSLLFCCPNLEECLAYDSEHFYEDQAVQLDKPLTLTHLKCLKLCFIDAITMIPSLAENLRLPSLEYLELRCCDAGEFDGCLLFCQNVSATLTTLKLQFFTCTLTVYHLRQLCRLSFPNLRKLRIAFTDLETMRGAIHALTKRVAECREEQIHYLPSLAALTLRYDDHGEHEDDESDEINPGCLLGLLEKWRVGEMSYFHLWVKELWCFGDKNWSPEVEEELRSIVGNRQIGITWNGRKMH